uniref:Uncharacterized protein n=1 Tax=Rhizophora mucronata TaxID=61149 RepID=A0A2P2Q922_RHIMU
MERHHPFTLYSPDLLDINW